MIRRPAIYEQTAYVAWHEQEVPDDAPLVEKLTNLRDRLIEGAPTYFDQLAQLLSQIARHTQAEVAIAVPGVYLGDYIIPTKELAKKSGFALTTFKSVSSILDKMWRKNQQSVDITLTGLMSEITDLVRLSVVAPTQLHARMFSDRLNVWEKIVSEPDRKKYLKDVVKVEVESEAKLASGYFAYHALIHFQGSFVVEVQIYSALAEAWRQLSHIEYEKVRLGSGIPAAIGGSSARLVSLGHLLHLAECELERLTRELR